MTPEQQPGLLFLTDRDSAGNNVGVRSGLLIAGVAFVGVLAALGFASDGSAAPKVVTVVITATGPSPSTVRIGPGEEFLWVNNDSVAHTLVFAHGSYCSLNPSGEPPLTIAPCDYYYAERVGSFGYSVDGRFPGKIVVVALARSVSLTARTHSVRLGSQLTLHGQETFDNGGAPFCSHGGGLAVTGLGVLARHAASQPFKRIAMFSLRTPTHKRPGKHGCTYLWQLKVRPGVTTTYIIQTMGAGWFWELATSRPFTVQIRP